MGPRLFLLPGNGLPDLYVEKMTTQFAWDAEAAEQLGDKLVSSRVYDVAEGSVTVAHHYAEGKITNSVHTYNHARASSAGSQTLGDAPITVDDIEDDVEVLQEMGLLERETFGAIRQSFNQITTVNKYRLSMEAKVELKRTVFEASIQRAESAVVKAESTEKTRAADANKSFDYLTPYLRGAKDVSNITKEEALEIRQTCLDAFKARLVERANIIHNRLQAENAKLARKQEQFQRAQRDGDFDSDEYEKYCTEAMFRIDVLEQRQAVHEEQALRKFAALDARLNSDVRLKVLKAGR